MVWIRRPKFVASNGVEIDDTRGIHVRCTAHEGETHSLTPAEVEAVSEYYTSASAAVPWHSAEPGELWEVDLERGGIRAVAVIGGDLRDGARGVVFRDVFADSWYDVDDNAIRNARRLKWKAI